LLEWCEGVDVGYVWFRGRHLALPFISRAMLQLHCVCIHLSILPI
jgi:hypothetical protein